ncbi:UNVERIFIED_CONTAM: hypothetical protein FKN15_077498 [Acipenser sinensis]
MKQVQVTLMKVIQDDSSMKRPACLRSLNNRLFSLHSAVNQRTVCQQVSVCGDMEQEKHPFLKNSRKTLTPCQESSADWQGSLGMAPDKQGCF